MEGQLRRADEAEGGATSSAGIPGASRGDRAAPAAPGDLESHPLVRRERPYSTSGEGDSPPPNELRGFTTDESCPWCGHQIRFHVVMDDMNFECPMCRKPVVGTFVSIVYLYKGKL